jgi:tape measure domain-containing protein
MPRELPIKTVFKAVDQITRPLKQMQSRIGRFSDNSMRSMRMLEMRFNRVNRSVTSIGKTGFVAATAGSAALGLGISKVVKEFSKLENAEAAFTPLLKSGAKAKEMVEAIQTTASTTPFQFENLEKSVRQLLPVMNGDINNTIKTLRMLGDTAGGNSQKLDSITRGFTKAMLKRKVDMESLNMIMEAGVPIFDDLRKAAEGVNLSRFKGATEQERFFKAISAGVITTDHLTKAFERMTSKGGIFFRGMEIASKTTTGKLSTMMDNFSLMLARNKQFIDLSLILSQSINQEKLAQTFKEVFGSIISMLNNVSSTVKGLLNNPSGLDNLKTVISGIVGLTKFIISNAKEIAIFGAAWVGLSIAIKTATVAMGAYNIVLAVTQKISAAVLALQLAINGAMKANPIRTLAVGLATLAGLAFTTLSNWQGVKSLFDDLYTSALNLLGLKPKDVTDFFGFTSSTMDAGLLAPAPILQRPTAEGLGLVDRVISNTQTTENFVTIRDETGLAEMQGSNTPFINLLPSGA